MQNMSLDTKRRFALSGSSDEDPYSLTSGNGSSGSSAARFNKASIKYNLVRVIQYWPFNYIVA